MNTIIIIMQVTTQYIFCLLSSILIKIAIINFDIIWLDNNSITFMYKITVVKSYVLSHITMNEYKHLKYCERTQNYN